jgi:hypothetical protein
VLFDSCEKWDLRVLRHAPGGRVRPEYEEFPIGIKEQYQDISICMDLMYVNKLPFLVTMSREIKFGTVGAVKSRHNKVLLPAITKSVKRLYALRGFRVKFCHADNEFEPMRKALLDIGMELNVVAEAEHVPEVERYIRTIKERTRSVYNTVLHSNVCPQEWSLRWFTPVCSG